MIKDFTKFPWHVILLSLYPSLSLWAYNLGQVGLTATYRAILGCLILGILLLAFAWLWLRDRARAGIVVTIFLLLFFSYGHIYLFLENVTIGDVVIGRHRFLAGIWLVLALLGIWWAVRNLRSPGSLNSTLNLVALFLFVFPMFNFVTHGFSNWRASQSGAVYMSSRAVQGTDRLAVGRPDVYYIILDGYGRSDILRDKLNFDNSSFLDDLRNEGFYIAECSQSNYGMTALSLASSLNMDYITSLGDEFTSDNVDRYSPLWRLIKDSAAESTFRKMGYQVVAFETGYDWTEFRNADYFFEAPKQGLSGFESLVLRDSAAVILDDLGWFDPLHFTPEDQKRNLVSYVLDKMSHLPEVPGPKFVFIHLVIPHQPFVFGPDGEPFVVAQRTLNDDKYYSTEDYLLGYGNQVRFISSQIPGLMKTIIQNSTTPPVIILQGDHGPAQLEKENRMGILNAYYFPEGKEVLYPTITPVNTFRVVFDVFFGTPLGLAADTSFYSKYSKPYEFEVIPNECNVP
ncbi:MAG: hypothetical protein ABI621_07490 [Chloroflexota bacterium]